MNRLDLERATTTAKALRDAYRDLTDKDDDLLHDVVEGETNLLDLVEQGIREARKAEAEAEILEGWIRDMRARRERFQHAAKGIRLAVARAMLGVGVKRHVTPDMTISARAPIKRVHLDLNRLPAEWSEPVVTRKPKTDEIRAALEAGKEIEGAALVDGEPFVIVRTT